VDPEGEVAVEHAEVSVGMRTRADRQAGREADRRLAAKGLAMLEAFEEKEHPVDHSPVSTIRPDRRVAQDWWLKFTQAGVVTVAGLLWAYLAGGHPDAALYGIIAAAILLPAAYLALRRALTTEELTIPAGGGLVHRNWMGRTRTVGREAIARVVLEPVNVSTITPRPPRWYLFLVDGDGRCRLRVLMSIFDANDVRRFVGGIGAPVEDRSEVVRPLRMRREMPGSFLWYSAHPWVGALVVMPLAIALVILLAVVFPSHHG
jgi:hypothetical protein